MSEKDKLRKDYPLVPLSYIEWEARTLAVSWIEDYEYRGFDIEGKHKLASDIMNYARHQTEPLRKIQDQLLAKIRTLEDTVKFGYSEGTPDQHNTLRIEVLETQLAAQSLVMEQMAEALRHTHKEIDDDGFMTINVMKKIDAALASYEQLQKKG